METRKIIFINQKGGVGKTTTCVNVGAFLANKGHKVLLVDLDAQGNMSSSVSAEKSKPGIYDVIVGNADLSAVQSTPVENLFCLSGGINMAGLAVELVDQEKREFFLANALKAVEGEYDYILADCPPALDLITMNALCWADWLVIPMQCEYFAMEGLNQLMKTVTVVRNNFNQKLHVLGIVFTMYAKRSRLCNQVVDNIKEFFKDLVFETLIPRNITLSEAPSFGLPITVYDKHCSGALAYKKLTKEIEDRVNN